MVRKRLLDRIRYFIRIPFVASSHATFELKRSWMLGGCAWHVSDRHDTAAAASSGNCGADTHRITWEDGVMGLYTLAVSQLLTGVYQDWGDLYYPVHCAWNCQHLFAPCAHRLQYSVLVSWAISSLGKVLCQLTLAGSPAWSLSSLKFHSSFAFARRPTNSTTSSDDSPRIGCAPLCTSP